MNYPIHIVFFFKPDITKETKIIILSYYLIDQVEKKIADRILPSFYLNSERNFK